MVFPCERWFEIPKKKKKKNVPWFCATLCLFFLNYRWISKFFGDHESGNDDLNELDKSSMPPDREHLQHDDVRISIIKYM